MTNFEQDAQFTSEKIVSVAPQACGEEAGWSLTFEKGFSLWCPGKLCAQPPSPGETARLYGKGIGYNVRGIVIDGRVYRYLTEAEEAEQHRQQLLERDRQNQERLDRERAERDARRAALPEPFRLRLDGFEAARPNWRRDHEPYELFCCEEATRLAARFPTSEALMAFSKLGHEEQKVAAPEVRLSEHSGNTFGAALNFAAGYLNTPGLVPMFHAAICPLLGCKECGCYAARVKGAAG